MNSTRNNLRSKQGAALIVALWVLIILSLIVGSFAFEAKLEAMLVSYKRKKYQAEMLAKSGVEYARAILDSARDEISPQNKKSSGNPRTTINIACLRTS